MQPEAVGESATQEVPARAPELADEAQWLELENKRRHRPIAPTLALRGIRKRWAGQPDAVLDRVDLNLQPGELTSISGRNGAGKTTLLRIVAGLILPDGGTIRLRELDPARDRRRYQLRLGFLSAGNSGLTARLSTRYQLAYWARLAFVPAGEREAAIERALTSFSLHELASQRVDRLSMGQRQRLRAAMAFLHAPELVLLDEPLTSLDDEGAAMVAAAVRRVTASGGAVVCCSPEADDHSEFRFDRRWLLEAGRLVTA
jgi:ABC-2 type transport system ATP-binding protein